MKTSRRCLSAGLCSSFAHFIPKTLDASSVSLRLLSQPPRRYAGRGSRLLLGLIPSASVRGSWLGPCLSSGLWVVNLRSLAWAGDDCPLEILESENRGRPGGRCRTLFPAVRFEASNRYKWPSIRWNQKRKKAPRGVAHSRSSHPHHPMHASRR